MMDIKTKTRDKIHKFLGKGNRTFISFNDDRKELFKIALQNNEVSLLPIERMNLLTTLRSCLNLEGDIAEVGVYRGGSAELICQLKEKKNLYLFDYFGNNLIDIGDKDSDMHVNPDFIGNSFDYVKGRLHKYPNVYLFKGIFPEETGFSIDDCKFCFVNLDVDTYNSTLACIKYFYPRMVHKGIILSHDYNNLIGVKRAFKEYCGDKIPIIELCGSQCFIIKC